MKHLSYFIFSLAFIVHAKAQVYANFATNLGNFKVELFYKEAPRTVGNFVTLAEGTRRWIDSTTGIVSTTKPPQPFYNDVVFHRIINDPGFKIAQVGSKNGQGTDGPGYTFPDEMRESVPLTYKFDQPYLLAMANSGFNTNGSQIFLTGNAIPHLEGKHTVFGRVTEGTAIVDTILDQITGNNVIPPRQFVRITSITIERVGAEAAKYRATSQRLPVVSIPSYKVAAAPAPAVTTNRYSFTQPQRSEFRCHVSLVDDLSTWVSVNPRWLGSPNMMRFFDLNYGTTPIKGFRPALVRYDSRDILPPGSFNGQKITMENAKGVHVFSIPRSGAATFSITPPGANPVVETGTITSGEINAVPYRASVRLVLSNNRQVRMLLGFDSKVKTTILGRCISEDRNSATASFVEVGGDKGFSMIPLR